MTSYTKNNIKKLLITVVLIVIINILGNQFFKRFDLTSDNRYTLSETTLNTLKNIKEPLVIDVFLDGEFPAQFKRLQSETRQILEEYQAYNENIIFRFNDPLADEATAQQYTAELMSYGLTPTNINQNVKGKKSLTPIFPWAIANIGEKSVAVPLLVNNFGNNPDQNINQSVQLLEFAFTDAITKLTNPSKKKIAILKGNGEMQDKYLADFLLSTKEYYALGEFNLDSLKNDLPRVLENLKRFDATIIAKPTEAFSEEEKYILDQYIMNGGKTIWLIDQVNIDLDHLQNEDQMSLATANDLNLDDMFFKYGFRINPRLIQDLLSTPITAKSAEGVDFPIDWLYSPILKSEENHPINKNINLVKMEFANQIDTLKNNIKKTVLLKTSPQSRVVGTPVLVGLNQFMQDLDESIFNNGNQITGALLEGNFTSSFKNRVKPFAIPKPADNGVPNKMIVIADGDIVNYNYVNKKPLVNGLDQWTQQVYGNKDFMMNCVNYLLDDNGLINIRSKNIELPLLDDQKVIEKYTFSQIITVGLPIVMLGIFGLVFTFLRKRKYS
ncbi:gliding-associated putative ABC transporter substrate-binding component GldG [Flavobacterium arsenatis]|uniref:Gliding-associated putative ABC transporter substrate-binding component GldG n=1 Tax=Flavobacterium arsenatis TaxID=1484332 RepID=A0ABU1TRH6_9FLAO|nr:gliding motility-associated ABC transporter substrate-binding protein GldG [Flavobacterium arsenatis]MDR6968474.1 gliding-associated putative ABC transporter substrate-binding component GldG [Flavobacterium arsenatis]